MFSHENGVPLLETVSEENRRNHGEQAEHVDGYYRESYDPEMTDMSHATFIGEGIIPLQTTAINNDRNSGNGSHAKSLRKFSLLHTFIPSFIFVLVAMTISAVLVLETDSEFFAPIRNWPEMNSLRYQYYQPLKEFIQSKIGHIF
jgi:FERM domain-containing protein 3/5